ncbi:MAG: DNA polymerase I [Gemmatimonadetes bacterium]|nr:DNA polymerase I [Gemmatimonadota bacterium]
MSDPPSSGDQRPTLFLIDGYALIYRAFFAMISRPLTTSGGENTSAPYGLARFLVRLLEEHEPEYVGMVFDAGDSFRTEVHPEYKATREKMPEELEASIPRCRALVEAFRVPVLEVAGWEADDVIGSLAAQASERGVRTVIVSGDKDFYQLIDENTFLLNPGRGGPAAVEEEWVTPENAADRLGVAPHQVTDYLALLGDSSDNVPGVPGIGKKTANALLAEFGSLDEIISRVADVGITRARKSLRENAERARLSRELVTIRLDVPIELDLDRLGRKPPDRDRLRQLFLALEFRSLVREFAPAGETMARESEYRLVTEAEELDSLVEAARKAKRVALAVVGSSGDPMRAGLVGLGLAVAPGRAWYLPFGHVAPAVARDEAGNPVLSFEHPRIVSLPALGRSHAAAALRELLADPAVEKIGHDLKFCLHVLERAGAPVAALTFDVSLASYCLDPGKRQQDLDLLSLERFGHTLSGSSAEVSGSDLEPAERDAEEVAPAVAEEADYSLRLAGVLEEDLRAHEMLHLFESVEMPLLPVLVDMERAGIRIDVEFFHDLSRKLRRDIDLIREEIFKIAGEEVNLRSVQQLRELLFDRLGLPVLKRTKTGPSTDESVLMALAAEGHQIPRLIVEHRELDKLDGTYVSKLPRLVNQETGRIHTSFNQMATTTGRLSSSDPNLQNIPIRSEIGRRIRKGFVPEEGWLFVGADYSQIELRVLAHLSGDPAFVEAFREGRDIHRETAARIFGVASEAVSPAMRDQAKTINFATIYGQGPVALAAQLGIGRAEARTFIDQYFERFGGVRDFLEKMKERARAQGYVETLIGRRRYIPEIRSRNPGMRGYGERTATNSPIQGTAADLIKIAMIRLHDRLAVEYKGRVRMLLQVHDELLFEVREGLTDEVAKVVREEMEGAADLDVPLEVDLGVGDSWYACKAG